MILSLLSILIPALSGVQGTPAPGSEGGAMAAPRPASGGGPSIADVAPSGELPVSFFNATVVVGGQNGVPPTLSGPGFFRVWLTPAVTTSGQIERFIFYTPFADPTTPAPLLVPMHSFGSAEDQIAIDTTFFEEARDRNWYAFAPLAAHSQGLATESFGSRNAQLNIRDGFEWIRQRFAVDLERIYGVGFSMGGGTVSSYAARHLDPEEAMFAAVLDHTGGISLRNTWINDAGSRQSLQVVMGGTLQNAPFEFDRCSVLSIPNNNSVNRASSMGFNLAHLPAPPQQVLYNPDDRLGYLVTQSQIWAQFLRDEGGDVTETSVFLGTDRHAWDTLDEAAVCDYFDGTTLVLPSSGMTLIDRSAVWFHFDVTQDAAGAFSPLNWEVRVAGNALDLLGTVNIQRIGVRLDSAGLTTCDFLEINVQADDSTGDDIVLEGMSCPPVLVELDGFVRFDWSFDQVNGTVTLPGSAWAGDNQPHTWVVAP